MKNLLIILAIILPIALSGQTETATQTTPEKKNTITASTFLGSTSGLAIDYRRGFSKNREFIIGANTSFSGARSLNIGFRKYYNTSNKLSIGFGLDAGLKNRQIIGDNFFTRAVEKTFLKVNYGQLRFVTGAYYKLDDRFDLMGEVQFRPLAPLLGPRGKSMKVGLKYKF